MSNEKSHVVIPGTELAPRPGARVVGPVDLKEEIEVTVRVRANPAGPGPAALEKLVLDLGNKKPGERTYLTRDQYIKQFGADPADLAKVEQFAQTNGLRVADSSVTERTVDIVGPVGQLAALFKTQVAMVTHRGQTSRERTGPIQVPDELQGIVEGVFGFDNRRMAETQYRRRHPAVAHNAADGSLSVPQVATAYNFPTGLTGAGQCIGILEFGGGFQTDDLKTFFNNLGMTTPEVVSVPVGPHDGNNPGVDPDADGEVALDIEVAGAVAPKAKIAVYFSHFTTKGWIDALNKAVHDANNKPSVISISWGFAEHEPLAQPGQPQFIWSQAAVNAVNQTLMGAAAMGVTVTCASGDDGSSDQFNDGLAHVDYPASSPFLLACGGTRLVASGTSVAREEVWNEVIQGRRGATGGGISDLNPLPSFQQNPPVRPSVNPSHRVGRGVPDGQKLLDVLKS